MGIPCTCGSLMLEHCVLWRSQNSVQRATLSPRVCRPASMANQMTRLSHRREVGGYKNRAGVDTSPWKLTACFELHGRLDCHTPPRPRLRNSGAVFSDLCWQGWKDFNPHLTVLETAMPFVTPHP